MMVCNFGKSAFGQYRFGTGYALMFSLFVSLSWFFCPNFVTLDIAGFLMLMSLLFAVRRTSLYHFLFVAALMFCVDIIAVVFAGVMVPIARHSLLTPLILTFPRGADAIYGIGLGDLFFPGI